MNFLTHIAAVLATVTITSTSVVKSPSIQNADGNFELLILHNNDMHARFEQTSQLSGTCTTADREAGKCYGGFPRVAHVVKEARRAAASGEGPPVLYLNAGDTYTGTAWFTIYKWKIAAEFINALEPDAMSIGNNDLEKGSSKLSPFLENLDTKILATNVIVKGQEKKLQKSIIFDIQGTKVGFVAYLTLDSNILDSAGSIEYVDEIIALKEEVTKLQKLNVNIIIALGHADIDKDMEIAREVEGLDLVIGGHKNIFSWTGASAEDQYVEKAIEVTQKSGKRVPVIQSYAYNNVLGKFHAKFDVAGNIAKYYIEPIRLDARISQDPEAVLRVNKLQAEIASRSEEVVGQTAVVLEGESCKIEECNLGNLIVDAINYYHALRFEGERWTDAPVSVIPGGNIASSIAPNNRPADVTLGDLLATIPTESHLVKVTMNGAILNQVLEHSVSTYSVSNPTGQLLQFSGIRAVYDLSRESGSRLVSAVVRCWSCFVPEFYTIDDWRDYPVIMPASMANGEYGYTMLIGLSRTDLEYDEITCTAEFIKLRSPVYPEVAGRFEFINYDPEPDMEDTTTTEPTTTAPTTTEPTTTEPTTTAPTTTEPTTTAPTTTTAPVTDEPDSAIAISSTLTSLGNHEFDEGVSGLTPFIENITCPTLAANLILNNEPALQAEPKLMKSVVFDVNGTKVGVIGYLTPDTKILAIRNNVEYMEEVIAIRQEAVRLKNTGVKILIALGHSGFAKDLEIAEKVEYIDLVIGGHTNTFLWNGTSPDAEKPEGPYPKLVKQPSGRLVPAVQAYAHTKYLGKLHLVFDADGEIISYDGNPVLLDNSIPQDPDVLSIINRYKDEIMKISDVVLGNTSVVLDGHSCRIDECNMGNLITDAMVHKQALMYNGTNTTGWTDAPIAIIQGGGIRSSIFHINRPANITKGDLLIVLPFEGKTVKVELNGSTIFKMLERSVEKFRTNRPVAPFLQFSGLHVEYNLRLRPGMRVVKALARCGACDVPEYSMINRTATYHILMPSFLALGGDGYSMFDGLPTTFFDYNELDAVTEYIKQHSPVYPSVEGRIVVHRPNVMGSASIPKFSLLLISAALIFSKLL